MNQPRTRFEGSTAILRVEDLASSIEYYRTVLGFQVDWNDSTMASVSRDAAHIMLCHRHQGNAGTWVWIGVEDVAVLYEEYKEKGVKFPTQPTNYPWAYEMTVEDPDGHILRFGSEPRSDEPYEQVRE